MSDETQKTQEQLAPEPQIIELDKLDILFTDNVFLKEQNENLRARVAAMILENERKELRDHIIGKYGIDTEQDNFEIRTGQNGKKILKIFPR